MVKRRRKRSRGFSGIQRVEPETAYRARLMKEEDELNAKYGDRWRVVSVNARRRVVQLEGTGRAVVRGKIVEERWFTMWVPRRYPEALPEVRARGWEPTAELCSHHRYRDGSICYGLRKDKELQAAHITWCRVVENLDSYVMGMVEYRIRGKWTYEYERDGSTPNKDWGRVR